MAAKDFFDHNIEWRIVVCRVCQHAVWPNEIYSHLVGKQHRCIGSTARDIATTVQTWTHLAVSPDHCTAPTTLSAPIPELPLFDDGLQCQLTPDTCQAVRRTLGALKYHWAVDHQWSPQTSSPHGPKNKKSDTARRTAAAYRTVSCQRFFPSRKCSQYFAIESEEATPSTSRPPVRSSHIVWPQLWEEATEKYQQRRNVDTITESGADEVNPWLRRTGWISYLQGCSTADLQKSIRCPDESDAVARVIWDAMGQLAAASQETVARSGVMLRFEAIRTERDQVRYQPLQAYRDRASVYERCRPWQQILMFFVRSRCQAPEWMIPEYRFNQRQARAFSDMIAAAEVACIDNDSDDETSSTADSDDTTDSDAWTLFLQPPATSSRPRSQARSPTPSLTPLQLVQAAILRFNLELLNQTLHSKETDMALVSALAVLGLNPDGVGFRGPDAFPSILSAIIKIAHFMVVQFAVDKAPASSSSTEYSPCSSACHLDDGGSTSEGESRLRSSFEWVRQMMDQFMVRGTGSPMQWMLDLRAYGMKIAVNTTSEGHVQWRDGDVLAYKNLAFSMVEFRGMVHQLVASARRALVEDVLFARDTSELPTIPWEQLFDDPSNSRNGWSFLDDPRTPWPVDGKRWLYQRVQRTEKLRQRFVRTAGDFEPHRGRIRDWFRQLDAFRGQLLALFHLTGGQPARGTELLSVRHSNTTQGGHRNLFIENGMVVFVCRYHKGYEFKGDVKIIHRYLPRAVGELVVWQQWLVLGFAQRMEALLEPQFALSSHLWPPDATGRTYTTDRLKRELQAATLAGLGQAVHVAAYRHIAIAISRRYVRANHAFQDDEAAYAAEDGDHVADEQAAHSAFTAGNVYARELDELPGANSSRRQQFREASLAWHRFLLFPPGGSDVSSGTKRSAEPWEVQAQDAERARKRQLRDVDLSVELSAMMQRPMEFRGVQRPALTAIQQDRSTRIDFMHYGIELVYLCRSQQEHFGCLT